MICKKLGWKPTKPLQNGLEKTCEWIDEQVKIKQSQAAAI
jgi:nucleoside-diphosphate-sugar epimerase